MDLTALIQKLVAVDSTPSHGTAEVASVVAALARDMKLECRVQEGHDGANIFIGSSVDAPLWLVSHLDTADTGIYSAWTKTDMNPFKSTIERDSIFGLGVAEAKGDFASKLLALKDLQSEGKASGVILVGTFGGENFELPGIRHALNFVKTKPRVALVGVPSDLRIVGSTNGALVVDVGLPFSELECGLRQKHEGDETTATHSRVFKGAKAHSSTPERGDSAILKMIRYLENLPTGVAVINMDGGTSDNSVPDDALLEIDLSKSLPDSISTKVVGLFRLLEEIQKEFVRYSRVGESAGRASLNVGRIQCMQDEVVLSISFRIPGFYPREVVGQWVDRMSQYVRECKGRLVERVNLAPFVINEAGALIKVCQDELRSRNLETSIESRSESNESIVLQSHGVECVPIGPGLGEGNVHGPNEFNSLLQLRTSIELYKRMCVRVNHELFNS